MADNTKKVNPFYKNNILITAQNILLGLLGGLTGVTMLSKNWIFMGVCLGLLVILVIALYFLQKKLDIEQLKALNEFKINIVNDINTNISRLYECLPNKQV